MRGGMFLGRAGNVLIDHHTCSLDVGYLGRKQQPDLAPEKIDDKPT